MAISITFLGAAHTVTGSCYLVEGDGLKFLIDCGMFQGPDVEIRNLQDFDFDASEIDFVLLTHTHIDHAGMLPKLVRHGFKGEIFATYHTIQLANILLLDSAKIQENNYREGIPWKHAGVIDLAYDTGDAQVTIGSFRPVKFDEVFSPRAGLNVTYRKAAHVLGAASIELELEGKKVVFSGDIGRHNHELIGEFDLDYKAEVDYVVMEALYGGEYHPERREAVNEMIKIIRETLENGGSAFIPAFAVQRTQELLHDIKIAKQSGALPADTPVWLDSPMAQAVTRIYQAALDHGEESIFDSEGLRYVRKYKESEKMSKTPGQIVIAGSGMADGGRILSHLSRNLKNKRNSVIFVGYQAEGTIGRALVEGAKQIKIDGIPVDVKAQIHQVRGFSAHGDTNDYLKWIRRYLSPKLKHIYLVHAEVERAEALSAKFKEEGIDHPSVPDWKEKVVLE
jgi:metallo-beta-lactamase family protein